jgi:hypothetical protein
VLSVPLQSGLFAVESAGEMVLRPGKAAAE